MAQSGLLLRTVEVCWSVLVVYWIGSARSTKRTIDDDGRFVHMLLVGAVLVAVVAIGYRGFTWVDLDLRFGIRARAIGCVACVGGCVLAVWSRRALGPNWSGAVEFKENHELVQHGPYALVRHPIYVGMLIMAVGSAVVFATLDSVIAAGVGAVLLAIKIGREEKMMMKHLPAQYAAYRGRVKAIVPFVL